ncbi:MAG: apolipoprotein N-acyltransferase [Hyphomicrobiaceae bacterium]
MKSFQTIEAWARQSRWRRRWCAFLAGALSILSMAPFHLWPVLWLTLPALLRMLELGAQASEPVARFAPWQRSTIGRAAEIGWWFGFGYHVFGLFWIGEAFLVEAKVFGWLLPFAVTALPAGLALFWAAIGAVTCTIPGAVSGRWVGQSHVDRVLVFALAVGVGEWLRGHMLTGFPWNVLGYALTAPLPLMQMAGVIGIYGLSVIAVLIFALPDAVVRDGGRGGDARTGPSWSLWTALAIAVLPLVAMWAYGAAKLARLPEALLQTETPIKVRIVQPSVKQRDKWRGEHQRRIFDQHLMLSRTGPDGRDDAAEGVQLIIWPEAAMPFFPLEQPIALAEIGAMLPGGTFLASGAMRQERSDDGQRRVFNSLMVFERGASAKVTAVYDKIHLVPFGEYLPLQTALEAIGLEQLSRLRGGFASGPWPRPHLELSGIGRLIPLICYEVIFPGAVHHNSERPRALLNVTNDGWFGDTTGPRQHLHQARVRAVEEAVPLVRAANNGISAMIDPLGRVIAVLPLNQMGALDVLLPNVAPVTLYKALGDKTLLSITAVIVLGLVLRRSKQGLKA